MSRTSRSAACCIRPCVGDDLEVVVNNAGFGLFGEFTATDLDDELRMIDTNIRAVLDSAQFIGGPYVKELEGKTGCLYRRKHCITCANGTDALQLAYMVAGVGPGTRCSVRT